MLNRVVVSIHLFLNRDEIHHLNFWYVSSFSDLLMLSYQ